MEEKNWLGVKKTIKFSDKDYIIDTRIFNIFLVLLCLIFVISYFVYGFDKSNHIYLECKEPTGCINQYFNSSDCGKALNEEESICTQERFQYLETYGEKPPFVFKYFGSFVAIGLAFCFILNHLLYNRQKKDEQEISN